MAAPAARALSEPISAALALIRGKHAPAVLLLLSRGPHRFSEVHRQLGAVSERILTKQLRELEEAGLVARQVFPEVPPRVEYSLTAYGTTLCPILKQLWRWGRDHAARAPAP